MIKATRAFACLAKSSLSLRVAGVLYIWSVIGGYSTVLAVSVSYTADLDTSNGQPVTNILILETDGVQTNLDYAFTLPGTGTSVLSHDVPFAPTDSLVIGMTEGVDKAQIVMFLNNEFAVANAGVNFSQAFPNTRHSELISRLNLAVTGDEVELAWFTDVFFPGDGAAAAFDTHGPFTVAEFTGLTIIGGSQTAGNWTVHSIIDTQATNDPGEPGLARSQVTETATDAGPFDLRFEIVDLAGQPKPGTVAIDKSVTNDSGKRWTNFELALGTGLGAEFVPSLAGDGLQFSDVFMNREETGAFPGVVVEEDRIVFSGSLDQSDMAQFVSFVRADTVEDTVFTIRQIATLVPEPSTINALGLLITASLLLSRSTARRRA